MDNKDKVFYRSENGGLIVNSLNLQIFLDDMYMVAKSVEDLDFIEGQLVQHAEMAREEAEEYLQVDDDKDEEVPD